MIEKNKVQGIDLMECFNAVRKHARFVGKVTVACVTVALVYCFLKAPTYQSVSLFRIKPEQNMIIPMMQDGGFDMVSEQTLNSYMAMLQSPDVVRGAQDILEENPDQKIVEEAPKLGGQISSTVPRRTDLVQVTIKSNSFQYAKLANDALLTSFMNKLNDMSRGESTVTRKFLEGRVKDAQKQLKSNEEKLTEFQQEHKLTSPENSVSLMATRFRDMDKQKADAQVRLAEAAAKAAAIGGQMHGSETALVADSATVNALENRLAELEKQRAEYSTKLTAKHPVMQKLQADIAELREQLTEQQQKVAAGQEKPRGIYGAMLENKLHSDAEAQAAAGRLAEIKALEEQYADDVDRMNAVNQEHLRLIREVNVTQELYIMLSKRLEEAKVKEASTSRTVQVVSAAQENETPIAPNKRKIVMVALLLGLLASSGFAIVTELMNRTIKTAKDVEDYLSLPVLGQIPDYQLLQEQKQKKKNPMLEKLKGGLRP